MRFLNYVLATISFLCVSVTANDAALPYELLYFYYAYKAEWEGGGSKNLGDVCRKRPTMCGFVDFVKDIMPRDFINCYRPPLADNIVDPSVDQAKAIRDAVSTYNSRPNPEANKKMVIPRKLDSLSPNGLPKTSTPFASFIGRIMDRTRTALNTGKVTKLTAEFMKYFVNVALGQRAADGLTLTALQDSLKKYVDPNVLKYLVSDGFQWYDWDKSLANIDAAVPKDLTTAQANYLKEDLREFSTNIRTSKFYSRDDYAVRHIALLQQYQLIVRQMATRIEAAGDADKIPTTNSGAACAPAVASSSKTTRRGLVGMLRDVAERSSLRRIGDRGSRFAILARSVRPMQEL